jgi:hypothetical protein
MDAKKGPCIGSCACMKWGSACTTSCGCSASCTNPFAQLPELFGESEARIQPSACFTTWLSSNQTNAVSLAEMILSKHTRSARGYGCDDEVMLEKLHGRFKLNKGAVPSQPEQRLVLAQQINRLGLSEGCEYWFSFCRNTWVSEPSATHCWECGNCMEWREWHCDNCNKCRYGVSIPCKGCGGTSESHER